MADQSKPTPPHSRQVVKFLTATTIGVAFTALSGLTLTATAVALILATPLLVLVSPVMVPAAIATFLVAAGFVFSGGCGVAAVAALAWVYNYARGKRPPGSEKLNYARERISETAKDMRERAREYGQLVQQKAQEATKQTQAS